MLVRKILRPCLVMKNTSFLTPCISAYHMTCVKMRKEDIRPATIENTNTLLLDLNTTFPSKILLTLEANKDFINGTHIVTAITKLMKISLKKKSNEKFVDWSNNDYFKQICSIIEKNMYKLSGSEAAQIMDIFNKVNMTNNVDIMYSLVKHVSQNVHNLSFIEICSTSAIIKRMHQTPVTRKAISALEHKFIKKMSLEFDDSNINHLDYGLAFVNNFLSNSKLLKTFIDKLQAYNDEIPLKNAITILETICKMNIYHTKCLQIYQRVKDAICQDIESLNSDQVVYIIYILSQRIRVSKREEDDFYNDQFFDKLIQKVVDDDMGFEKALSALKSVNFVKHENKELLNYCSASYFERTIMSEDKIEDESGKLLVLINGLALSKHKTVFWDQIESFLLSKQKELLTYNHKTLCIFSVNLVCLDYYPHYLLEKVFDDAYTYPNDPFIQWTFCKLYQKIKSDPHYNGPLPSPLHIESLQKLHQSTWKKDEKYDYQLIEPLIEGVGGKRFVKTNLGTRLFHVIDYLVVYDENGNPVPINDVDSEKSMDLEYLEDLSIPPNCKIICIMNLPYFWYWRNTQKLLGLYTILIDSLESLNCSVIHFSRSTWKTMPTDKRKDFLMDKIKSKLASKNV